MLLGVAWYTADTWEKVKSTAVDPDRFEETFKEWEVMANETLDELKKWDVNPSKVFIDPSQFAAWRMLKNETELCEFPHQHRLALPISERYHDRRYWN